MWVPEPPLLIDTTLIDDVGPCKGIEYYSANSGPTNTTRPAACGTPTTVTAPDTLTMSLASAPSPAAGEAVCIATYGTSINTSMARANFHDSSAEIGVFDGNPLYNYPFSGCFPLTDGVYSWSPLPRGPEHHRRPVLLP
jgi:hypothetical protein